MASAIYGRPRADRNPPGESPKGHSRRALRRRLKAGRRRRTPWLARRVPMSLRRRIER